MEECIDQFNLSKFVIYLKNNDRKFNKIALQISDNLLDNTIKIINFLQKEFPNKFFFTVAETSYGVCCADEVAALHLKADLIVRIGRSCLTQTQTLPVYFINTQKKVNNEKLENALNEIEKTCSKDIGEFMIIYEDEHESYFSNKSFPNNYKISLLPYSNEIYEKISNNDLVMYNRVFKEKKLLNNSDCLIYFGQEDSKTLFDICLKYVNSNKIIFIDENNYNVQLMNFNKINLTLRKRFNLIQKAKESEVFGIIVGSLSIKNINKILNLCKKLIQSNNKKCYVFLLGKITLEKLSNFVEFIDIFILLACPECSNNDLKALMKPIITPMDLFLALNEDFQWTNSYSFDNDILINMLGETGENILNLKYLKIEENQVSIEKDKKVDITDLVESKNQQVAKVFNLKIYNHYENRKYKGLEIYKESDIKKFEIGRTGIPIKYEIIKEN